MSTVAVSTRLLRRQHPRPDQHAGQTTTNMTFRVTEDVFSAVWQPVFDLLIKLQEDDTGPPLPTFISDMIHQKDKIYIYMK